MLRRPLPKKILSGFGTKYLRSHSWQGHWDAPRGPFDPMNSWRRLRPGWGPNSPMPLAPLFRNTWRHSCANWRMATRRSQRLFLLMTPYFPLEIRNSLRKFKAPRQR